MADHYGVTIRIRPLTHFPREQTVNRQQSPFRSGSRWEGDELRRGREVPYADTEILLCKEVRQLGATEVVIQIDAPESAFRVDGSLKVNARLPSAAVVVGLVAPGKGPLSYPSDLFTTWQANVRAVAKTLEALRMIDRYGTTPHGEQYVGWKELPSGTPLSARPEAEEMSLQQAARIVVGMVSNVEDLNRNASTAIEDPDFRRYAYRQALKGLHPDAGGDDSDGFLRLQRAIKILDENDG